MDVEFSVPLIRSVEPERFLANGLTDLLRNEIVVAKFGEATLKDPEGLSRQQWHNINTVLKGSGNVAEINLAEWRRKHGYPDPPFGSRLIEHDRATSMSFDTVTVTNSRILFLKRNESAEDKEGNWGFEIDFFDKRCIEGIFSFLRSHNAIVVDEFYKSDKLKSPLVSLVQSEFWSYLRDQTDYIYPEFFVSATKDNEGKLWVKFNHFWLARLDDELWRSKNNKLHIGNKKVLFGLLTTHDWVGKEIDLEVLSRYALVQDVRLNLEFKDPKSSDEFILATNNAMSGEGNGLFSEYFQNNMELAKAYLRM